MSGRGGGRHFGPAERLINQFVMERERSAATLQPWHRAVITQFRTAHRKRSARAGLAQLQGAKCQAKFSISAISAIVGIKTIPSLHRPGPTPGSGAPAPPASFVICQSPPTTLPCPFPLPPFLLPQPHPHSLPNYIVLSGKPPTSTACTAWMRQPRTARAVHWD